MSYSTLRGRIREVYGTETAFSEAMGMNRVSMSNKLNNKVPWTSLEMDKAKKLLQISDAEFFAYFFTPTVHIL